MKQVKHKSFSALTEITRTPTSSQPLKARIYVMVQISQFLIYKDIEMYY